nr:MAG TPA: hypothetical protein [Caudoviricetes sp.]
MRSRRQLRYLFLDTQPITVCLRLDRRPLPPPDSLSEPSPASIPVSRHSTDNRLLAAG